ncbi:hypothetical protein TVAG_498620 [Trichomonas vaginalis G3]|uniref:Uncharacterized protein n=1 Tax=Trichomonas vaginalis (strain ATCC PRA-98 / G3) TaxID=412133 RepID=A2E850_TRIV3|nr:spectrin binding [Trichomonas vaginalis G3]EAY11168.1 hypothetical protein TVAG_498620 [Trichomonas vaginalis G3]KAI5500108.1 spectrin binding [Trichomonas vaginalis G3]|eukprot:XP_001323391.1 hypothetical protein [Trichomonas vaginalis G3]
MGCNVTQHNKNGWTAGHFAASVGSLQILQALHECGDPLNQRNGAAWTPLHYAMKYGHRQCVDYLVRIKAFVFDQYDSFASLIHMAAISNFTNAVQAILDRGHGYDTVTHNNWDFLLFAAANGGADLLRIIHSMISHDKFLTTDSQGRTLFHVAAINFRLNVITTLVDLGLTNISEVDRFNKTPLHYAAEYGYPAIVDYLSSRIDINARDYLGKTALHYAAANKYFEVVNLLASNPKIQLDLLDNRQKTAIMCACEGGSVRCVDFLIHKGANTSIPAANGLTLPIVAVMKDNYELLQLLGKYLNKNDLSSCDNRGCNAAHYAAQLGLTKFLEYMSEKVPDTIFKANHKGRNPLAVAASWGKTDSLDFFFKVKGIDLCSPDNEENTPLHLAIYGGHHEFAKALLRTKEVEINAQNDAGETPLMLAIVNWLRDVISDIFSTSEWDPNLADNYGRTALMLAAKEGQADVVQVILSNPRIDPSVTDNDGWGPQHFAAFLRTPEVMKILESKLKLDIITKKGLRPIDIARNNDNSEIVEYIARKQDEMMPRRRNAQQNTVHQTVSLGTIARTSSGSLHPPDLRKPQQITPPQHQQIRIESNNDYDDEEEEDFAGEEEEYFEIENGAEYGDDDYEFRKAEMEAMGYDQNDAKNFEEEEDLEYEENKNEKEEKYNHQIVHLGNSDDDVDDDDEFDDD